MYTQNQVWPFLGRVNILISVINPAFGPKQLLLPSLIGKMSADLVPIFFGLEERDQVQARPDLFAGEFTILSTRFD